MRFLRSAILLALFSFAVSARSHAELMLVSGSGPASIATNNYGYTGTYHDLYGPSGAQDVSHPGGGPVAFLFVYAADGALSLYYDAKAGPYDGTDDTQIGVLNNSSSAITKLSLTSTTAIFGFDSDGIDTYGATGNATDTTGYGGLISYFTNINTSKTDGTVNFIGGLAADGGKTFFSLEVAPSVTAPPTAVPEPSSLVMAGFGMALAAGYARRLRKGVGASTPVATA